MHYATKASRDRWVETAAIETFLADYHLVETKVRAWHVGIPNHGMSSMLPDLLKLLILNQVTIN